MVQTGSRTTKTIRNTAVGLIGLILSQLVTFVTKSVFVRLLGAEYNGVNGLFSNVLSILNLAELGFATSVAYALYKPLQEGDELKQAALMNYFARVYRIIAVIVAVVGCCCIPFLQYLIAEDISELSFSLNQLRGYFAMFLANTVCSYLLAYKRTIITADQNNYIISTVDNSCNIALNVLQIVLLLIYNNYYAYLATMIAKTLINNIILQIIADKKYPQLRKYKRAKLLSEDKKSLLRNVEASFVHRLGNVAMTGTTSIIISSFVSLIAAGQYSNYAMICSSVNMVIDILFTSMTASLGNLCVSESEEAQYQVFKRVRYLSYFCGVFTLVCYICLFNPFIEIWVGEDMLMPFAVVVAISFNSSKTYFRKAVNTFKDAKGMFRADWYKPIIEAVVSIGTAIGLSYVWGTFGVIFGHIIATMVFAVPIEYYVLFKKGLHKPLLPQFAVLAIAIAFAFGLTALTYFICSYIPNGIGWFILRFLFVVVFAAGAFILATFRMPEFKYYKTLAGRIFKAMIAKIKAMLHKGKNVAAGETSGGVADIVEHEAKNAEIGTDNGAKEDVKSGIAESMQESEKTEAEKRDNDE